jgi:putative oxidoreductase
MKTHILTFLKVIITPVVQKHWFGEVLISIPRILCGLLLTLSFGSDKFGLPWSSTENLAFFEVAAWFPEDVAKFGGIFSMFPVFFAWSAAFAEAVGGLFLAIGFKTRIASFLIMCTMLVAIFFQKWNQGLWGMLPALGFLWVSIYHLYLGSGKFGIDYIISKKLK